MQTYSQQTHCLSVAICRVKPKSGLDENTSCQLAKIGSFPHFLLQRIIALCKTSLDNSKFVELTGLLLKTMLIVQNGIFAKLLM